MKSFIQFVEAKQGNNREHFDHGTKSGRFIEEVNLDEISYRDSGAQNMMRASRKADKEVDKMRAQAAKRAEKEAAKKKPVKEEKDPRIEKAGVKGFNKPKGTPSHPEKSHIVVAKDGDRVKTIRFGQQGADTAGDPKQGESDRMKMKRKSFKARHGKNIAKGKMSAAYWSDKVKW